MQRCFSFLKEKRPRNEVVAEAAAAIHQAKSCCGKLEM
jgi:hypothetical protein